MKENDTYIGYILNYYTCLIIHHHWDYSYQYITILYNFVDYVSTNSDSIKPPDGDSSIASQRFPYD